MKLTKLYVNDQAKHVVLPMVMGHAANKLYIKIKIKKMYTGLTIVQEIQATNVTNISETSDNILL